MQQHGFWFVVRAWGRDLSSHLVQYGQVTSWESVEDLLFRTRYRVEGKSVDHTIGIWCAAMDTGGGKSTEDDWTRTEEICHWIRKNGRGIVFGVKGASNLQIKWVNPRVIDKMNRGNRPIHDGLVLYYLISDGTLSAFRIGGRQGLRIKESELELFLDTCEVE